MISASFDIHPFSDRQCRECEDERAWRGLCVECPFNHESILAEIEGVTDEHYDLCRRIQALDSELEEPLRIRTPHPKLSILEKAAIRVLRDERRRAEKARILQNRKT